MLSRCTDRRVLQELLGGSSHTVTDEMRKLLWATSRLRSQLQSQGDADAGLKVPHLDEFAAGSPSTTPVKAGGGGGRGGQAERLERALLLDKARALQERVAKFENLLACDIFFDQGDMEQVDCRHSRYFRYFLYSRYSPWRAAACSWCGITWPRARARPTALSCAPAVAPAPGVTARCMSRCAATWRRRTGCGCPPHAHKPTRAQYTVHQLQKRALFSMKKAHERVRGAGAAAQGPPAL